MQNWPRMLAAMTLDQYITEHAMTNAGFGEMVGADHSTIARMRKNGQVPSKTLMDAIHKQTGGLVQPNDFYSIGNAA